MTSTCCLITGTISAAEIPEAWPAILHRPIFDMHLLPRQLPDSVPELAVLSDRYNAVQSPGIPT